MLSALPASEFTPLVVRLQPVLQMTEEQFFEFCHLNSELHIERTAEGDLIIMPPTGSATGGRNFKLIQQLANWTEQDGTGIGFDSSTGFTLPNGAKRSTDAAWIQLDRWNQLTEEEQERFAPISPDFVVELRSPSDNLEVLQVKMQEYIANGVQLGWLIDRPQGQVWIYRADRSVTRLEHPEILNGESVLPGFELDLSKVW
jgi:Uma2 family endonuclease